jgi:DNA-directed RNA polymerase subunit N (RpoN/RPB10)
MAMIVPVACLKCGKKIKKSAAWLKREKSVCPHCGTALGTKEFQKAVTVQEKSMNLFIEVMKPKPRRDPAEPVGKPDVVLEINQIDEDV